MDIQQAQAVIDRVSAAQEGHKYLSAYAACKAAGVSVAEYKTARFAVLGPNQSA